MDIKLSPEQLKLRSAARELAEAAFAPKAAEIDRTEAREHLNALMGLWGTEIGWTVSPRLPELPPEAEPLERIESRAVAASLALAQRRIEIDREAERLGFVRETRLAPDLALGVGAERESESGLWTVGPALAGVAISLLAAGVQVLGLKAAEHFNHNDAFHVLETVAVCAFYRAARRFDA